MSECVVCGNKTHKLLNEMCMACHEPEEVVADFEIVSTSIKRMRETIDSQSLTIRQQEAAIKELKGECYAWAKDKFTTEDSFEKYKYDLDECIEAAKKAITDEKK